MNYLNPRPYLIGPSHFTRIATSSLHNRPLDPDSTVQIPPTTDHGSRRVRIKSHPPSHTACSHNFHFHFPLPVQPLSLPHSLFVSRENFLWDFSWIPVEKWREELEEEKAAVQRRNPSLGPSKPVYSSQSVGSAGTWRKADTLSVSVPVLRFTSPPCSST